jgi:tetratricopeptide (TPR) repeat protein
VERAMKFRSLIEQATKDFRTGKFEEAIGGYWSAYQLRSQPLLLFNIAQVHRKVGHTQEALMFYERYLNADPRSDLAAEVRVYVHALRASQQSVAESANAQSVSPQSQGIGGTTSTNELDVFVPQALPSPTDNFLGTEEQRQIAFRQHSEAAAASFRRGDYKTTEAEYWAAYGLKPQTIILFNIAQVYRKEERWNEALTLFRRYLKEEPSSTLAGEVEGRIAEANARIQTQKRDSERLAAERLAKANVLLAERMMELRDIDRKIAAQGSSGNAKPVYRRPWFWGILGVTIVGVGLGVGLGVVMHPPLDPSSDLGLRVVYFR